jgi:hypothetical protein
LTRFSGLCTVVALGLGVLGFVIGVPWWIVGVVIFIASFGMAWVARRRETGRWSYERRSWTGEQDGRQVELVFDEKLVVLNRLTLCVDGEEVARETIFYGTKELSGSGVRVRVGSGWAGECVGVVLRNGSGAERALTEQPAR